MAILIKGVEMPKDCMFCPMAHWNKIDRLTGCEVVGGKRYVPEMDTVYWESGHRPDWCPLVEVPKHGRLIDADVFDKTLKDGEIKANERKAYVFEGILNTIRGNLAKASTIIEAEEDDMR